MPIVNVQGVGKINFPETMSHEAIIHAIENEILQQKPPAPEPIETTPAAPPSTDRTWGEALKDVALSLPSGGGQIMQLPAQVARLAGANVTPDSILGGIEARGQRAQDIVQEMRSPGYKTQAAGVQQRIAEAGPEGGVMGAIKKAPTAMYEYLSSPTMMSVFLTEQIPQLALTGGAGKGAQALRMLFGDAAKLTVEEAAKVALKTGVRTEIASGAVLQGMDIGSDTYKEVHDYLKAQGKTEPEAHAIALEKGRTAAAGAAVASLVAQNLPGARKAQEALLGGSVGKNAWRGAAGTGFGESYSEGIEEGAGAAIKGQLAAQVNPQRDPYAGVGEATGMGAAAGFGIGAPLGAISGGANAAQLAKQAEDQKSKIIPTGNPVSSSPIVSTMTINRAGVESVKTQHEDGTVDIDGVQVVPSGVGAAAAETPAKTPVVAPPAATDISKSGLQTVEGREAGRTASHLTAEEQGDEEVLAAVQLGKEIYEANPSITRAEFVTKLRDQTGFSDKKLANIIKEVGRPRRRKTTEAEVTDEGETEADLQSQLAAGQAEITDEGETEADLRSQLAAGQAEITDEGETKVEKKVVDESEQGATPTIKLNQPFVDSGRVIAITEVNGVRVPFYISTGSGGKASVPTGKWYPFFGIGKDGWFNKGSEKDINDFYGSAALKAKAEELNKLHGDIRERMDDGTLPFAWDGKSPRNQWHTRVLANVNEGLTPVPNNIGQAGAWTNNVNSLLARINKTPAAPTAVTPAELQEKPREDNNKSTGTGGATTSVDAPIRKKAAENTSVEPANGAGVGDIGKAAGIADVGTGSQQSALNVGLGDTLEKIKTGTEVVEGENADLNTALTDLANSVTAVKLRQDNKILDKTMLERHLSHVIDAAERITSTGHEAEQRAAQRALKYLGYNAEHPLYKEIVERLTKIKNVISEQQSNRGEAKQLYARINVLKNTKATLASELKYIRTENRQLAAPDINNINELHKLIAENDASLKEANNAKRALEREAKKTSYIDEAAVVRSQVRGSGPALLFDRVVALVDSIKSRWAGSPKVHTVPTFLALPPHLQEFLIKHKALDAPGIYDTKSKEVFIIADKLASEADVYLTVIHEVVGHHGLRTVLGSKYDGFMKLAYFNPEIKALADRNMEENEKLSKAIAVEEALAEKSESNILNTPAIRQLLDKLVSLIRTGLRAITGGRVAAKFSDAEVRNIINASYRAIKDGSASSVSAVTAEDPPAAMSPVRTSTAGAMPMPTIDDMVKANTNILNSKLTKNSPWKWAKFMASPEGWHWLTFKFENTRVYAKNVENILRLQGTLTFTKKGFNALYSALTTAGAKAQDIIRTRLGKHEIALDESVKAYAAAKKLNYEEALATLDLYSKAQHEPERRHIFFLLHSPLLNDRTGKTVSHPSVLSNTVLTPADMRVEVMKIFVNAKGGLNASDITTYANILEDLAKNYVVKDGYSPTNNKAIDENSQDYAPIAEWDVARVAVINNAREADAITHGSLLDNYFNAMKSLQEATKEVNKESYHWTSQVDNFVNLYKAFNNGAGWQNYVPYKGHLDVGNKNALIDPRSTRMSSEYKDVEMPMSGGKENDSENVILQALVDSAKSAWLLGSSDVPLAIKNNIESPTKDIAGKLIAVSTFADRHSNPLDIARYKGEKAFFHRLPNGDIEIYTVVNDNLRESIRQSYTPPQYIMQQINTVTSIVGQFHTRFNLSFAPSNYVRDSLTNASTVALEAHGPKVAAQYLASVSGKVLDGGMIKIGNLMRLYDQGRIPEIEALTIKDKTGLLTDALEYLKSGGRVAQRMSYNTDSQLKQLIRPHGRNFVFKTQDGILKWIDVWNDSFEMTNRVAMYSVLKADITAKNIAKNMSAADAKEAAIAEASSIAKNLANFETVGEWGRSAGALYMYFRAAATGAFRAFDALSPAWTSAQTKVNQMSEEARNDLKLVAEVEKNFKKLQIRSRVGIAALSAAGAALYTMAYLASDDDEMGRNKVATDDMSRWTRYLRLPMSIFTDSPGYKDKFVQAPWGFGPSAFMAIGAQTAAMVSGNMKFSDYAGNFIQIGMDSFMPIPISRISPTESPSNFIIDSIAPSLARPFIEFNSNMNALGAPIYNDRQYRYGGAYTGGDSIPEIYKDVAKMFFDMSDGDINISPNSVYFFASNFADGAMQIASAGRNIYLTSKGEKDFDIKSDTLLLNSFVGKASNYDARQYDAVKKQIEGMKGRLDMLKDKPEQLAQYVSAHPLEPMIVDIYQKQINGLLKTVQTQANTIRSATYLTPKDKKDILEPLTSSQNYIKRGLIDMFDAFDIKP